MLDKRCLALLGVINAACLNSGYKVFSFDELVLSMPMHFGIDVEGVKECLSTLAEREYLSVKYEDEVEVCVCPLPKGRLIFENRIDEQIEKSRAEKRYFTYSFFGSVLGGSVVMLIAVIICFLVGRV